MYLSKIKQKAIIDLYQNGYTPSQIALAFSGMSVSADTVVRLINEYRNKQDVVVNNPTFNSLTEGIDFDSFFNHICEVLNRSDSIQLLDIVLVIFALIKEHNFTIEQIATISEKLKIFKCTDLSRFTQIENKGELKAYIEEIIRHYSSNNK